MVKDHDHGNVESLQTTLKGYFMEIQKSFIFGFEFSNAM
jgi:hypothetical protein